MRSSTLLPLAIFLSTFAVQACSAPEEQSYDSGGSAATRGETNRGGSQAQDTPSSNGGTSSGTPGAQDDPAVDIKGKKVDTQVSRSVSFTDRVQGVATVSASTNPAYELVVKTDGLLVPIDGPDTVLERTISIESIPSLTQQGLILLPPNADPEHPESLSLKQNAVVRMIVIGYDDADNVIGPLADLPNAVSTFTTVTFGVDGNFRYTSQIGTQTKEGSIPYGAASKIRIAASPRSVPAGQHGLIGMYGYRFSMQ